MQTVFVFICNYKHVCCQTLLIHGKYWLFLKKTWENINCSLSYSLSLWDLTVFFVSIVTHVLPIDLWSLRSHIKSIPKKVVKMNNYKLQLRNEASKRGCNWHNIFTWKNGINVLGPVYDTQNCIKYYHRILII